MTSPETVSHLQHRLHRLLGYLQQDPNNLGLLADVVDAAIAVSEVTTARSALSRALLLQPDDAYLLLRLSSLELSCRNFEESLQITQTMLDNGAGPVPVLYNHAYALFGLRQFVDARDIFRAILEVEPQNHLSALMLMRACHYLAEIDEAIAVGLTYTQRFPENADLVGQLALLFVDADQLQQADVWAQKALSLSPLNLEGLLAASTTALGRELTSEAVEYARRAITIQPRNGRAWANIGLAQFLSLDLPAAQTSLSTATECMPEHIGTWHLLGWARLLVGDIAGAEDCFQRALAIDDAFGETYGGLAAIAASKGDWAKSDEYAKVARRLDPDSMSAYYSQILRLMRDGRHESASGIMDRALLAGRAPGGGTLKDMLSRLLHRNARQGPEKH